MVSDEFMLEYFNLQYMKEVPAVLQVDAGESLAYISYLSLVRQNATSNKVRNVFNTTSLPSNGVSLNETIHHDRKLQNHIFDMDMSTEIRTCIL